MPYPIRTSWLCECGAGAANVEPSTVPLVCPLCESIVYADANGNVGLFDNPYCDENDDESDVSEDDENW